ALEAQAPLRGAGKLRRRRAVATGPTRGQRRHDSRLGGWGQPSRGSRHRQHPGRGLVLFAPLARACMEAPLAVTGRPVTFASVRGSRVTSVPRGTESRAIAGGLGLVVE